MENGVCSKTNEKDVVPHKFLLVTKIENRLIPELVRMGAIKRATQSINQDVLCEASTPKSDLPIKQEILEQILYRIGIEEAISKV